jgi:hypothetical protein
MTRLAALLLVALFWLMPAARAEEYVDVAIVLLSDVSRSVDEHEYKLMKDGYAAAFTNQRVIDAIKGGPMGAVAVAYVEFAGAHEVVTVLGWRLLRDRATSEAFVAELLEKPRTAWGRTAIGTAIDHGVRLLEETSYTATRRVIDVCADGTSNVGRDVPTARDDAVGKGIIINALAIISEAPFPWQQAHVNPPGGLPNYFRENVAGGPGAFVLEVRDFPKFGEAMTRKLILEIAGLTPGATDFAVIDQAAETGPTSNP